ncbi:MAG TPA: GxxExxY protein [Pyrinomonadaceae bacterium]|jgi:GxxExxY protein
MQNSLLYSRVMLSPMPASLAGFTAIMTDDELTRTIIGCAYKVHNALGPGFLEKVYENAMRIELEKIGMAVKQQQPVNVIYDGHFVGQYYADLWVNERVVIELRAVRAIAKEHEVQLVNYLTATQLDVGLLLNFGSSVQVKRKFREFKPKGSLPGSIT